jgi:hypothetical protein
MRNSALIRRPSAAATVLAALAAVLPGCGGSESDQAASPSSHGADPAAVAKSYLLATLAGDGARACRLMTPRYRRSLLAGLREGDPRIRGLGCEDALARLGSAAIPVRSLARLIDVEAVVRVRRAAATLNLSGKVSIAVLVRRQGRWRVAQFEERAAPAGHGH